MEVITLLHTPILSTTVHLPFPLSRLPEHTQHLYILLPTITPSLKSTSIQVPFTV